LTLSRVDSAACIGGFSCAGTGRQLVGIYAEAPPEIAARKSGGSLILRLTAQAFFLIIVA